MIASWYEKNWSKLVYGLFLTFVVSIFYSKFLLSLSMIGLLILAILSVDNGKFGINSLWKDVEKTVVKHRSLISLTLIFLIVLLTMFYSRNFMALFWQIRLKLPFLLMPLCFLAFPRLSKKQYYGIYLFYVILISISALGVLINYLLNFSEINEVIKAGQSIPTPIDHIKFSIACAFAFIVCVIFVIENHVVFHSRERVLMIPLAIFLFVIIHILSVRSGMLVMYAAISILGIKYLIQAKRKWPLVVIGLLVIISPFVAYKTIPSFKNKVGYSLWDLKMYNQGAGENYSDTGRIRSIIAGWELVKESPVFGVGFGDMKDAMWNKYHDLHGENASSLLAHNQFLTIWIASGILGLVVFLFALIQPLVHNKAYRDSLLLGFSVIIWSSFLVENTIERSYSIGFYLFFTLIAIHYNKPSE